MNCHKHLKKNTEDHLSISDKQTEDRLCEHLMNSMSDKECRTLFICAYDEENRILYTREYLFFISAYTREYLIELKLVRLSIVYNQC